MRASDPASSLRRRTPAAAFLVAWLAAAPPTAAEGPEPEARREEREQAPARPEPQEVAPLNQLGSAPTVAGFDPGAHLLGGLPGRDALADAGLSFSGALFVDTLHVLDGPEERTEVRSLGVLDAGLDTGSLGWWDHGTVFARVYAGLATDGAEAFPATLQEVDTVPAFEHVVLGELWYEQRFPDARLRVRAGRMDANSDFAFASAAAALVTDSAAVTPTNYGIPSYLDPALGALAFFYPEDWSFGVGVYRGTLALPSEAGLGDLRFVEVELDSPEASTYVIGEAARRWGYRDAAAWPGALKLGGWLADGDFRRLDGTPGSTITGAYLVFEQSLHAAGAPGPDLFVQLGFTEDGFSPVRSQAAAGLAWTGLFPGRPADTTAAYVSRAGLSSAPGSSTPEAAETVFELTHAFQLTPWLRVQPDVQHVLNAGGDPRDLTLAGLRLTLQF